MKKRESVDRRVEVEEGLLKGEGRRGEEEGLELGEEDLVFLGARRISMVILEQGRGRWVDPAADVHRPQLEARPRLETV